VKPGLLEILRATGTRSPLRLEQATQAAGEIDSGILRTDDGRSFEVREGIPRFVEVDDAGQAQTRDAFGFKWAKRDTYDSPASRDRMARWLLERYGFATSDEWAAHFQGFGRVLDVGCGSGLSSGSWLTSSCWRGSAMWVGVDVSTAVDVARARLGGVQNSHFVQADALDLPFADGTFGAVFSEGVLHHTPSTRAALLSAARVLASGGECAFYVYRKKGPAREFTDDYVRSALQGLGDEEAWEVMRGFTRLAQALSSVDVTVDVPEAVPLLGIPAGRQHVQRFVYWHFAKLYWNDEMSFEENVHVNFDWYRPVYAHRQTAGEVRAWCEEAALEISRFDEQESGFTVVARKR
jgi:SAM-dependent methyltransferase